MGLFDMFKKKEKTVVTIYSPMNGKVIELKDVPDEAFAQKMVGDGCAIEPDKGVICSPVDGQLMNIFPTNHALIFETVDSTRSPIIINNMEKVEKIEVLSLSKIVKIGEPIMKVTLK